MNTPYVNYRSEEKRKYSVIYSTEYVQIKTHPVLFIHCGRFPLCEIMASGDDKVQPGLWLAYQSAVGFISVTGNLQNVQLNSV